MGSGPLPTQPSSRERRNGAPSGRVDAGRLRDRDRWSQQVRLEVGRGSAVAQRTFRVATQELPDESVGIVQFCGLGDGGLT